MITRLAAIRLFYWSTLYLFVGFFLSLFTNHCRLLLDWQRKLKYSYKIFTHTNKRLLCSLTLFPRCKITIGIENPPWKKFFSWSPYRKISKPPPSQEKNTKVHIHVFPLLLCLANFTNVKHRKRWKFEKWNVHNFQAKSWSCPLKSSPWSHTFVHV